MTTLAERLLPDAPWERVQPCCHRHLPTPAARPAPCRTAPAGIKVRIARRGVESSKRLGRHRWKAERSIAWLAGCRRLRIRYGRDSERFFAFAMLAGNRLCYNRLPCAATARLP